ncbi:hypothetical protein [Mesoplasma melaleucae]|uniref:Uncharacterized protein n=1 Tax=Mesoplasma melaleucae TaxID=81459 RepID=A0A2K8NYQ2_9MOLU|nr:hypothetical protein [Mesoplasma melaleucae]ATZ17871.1 hypothetical protein EMELA_v1c02980 [Mesoplasma melaleucae]
MKKQANRILLLNILNIIFTIVFSLAIVAIIMYVCISLKQTFVAVLALLPILSIVSLIVFYLISYKKEKMGITNLLLFMCSLNIFSLLVSFKLITEKQTLDMLKKDKEIDKAIVEKTNLMASWEIELEKEKLNKKLSKLKVEDSPKRLTKKEVQQKNEERKREIYKSYSKFVYGNILINNSNEKNTFKLITLTVEFLKSAEYLEKYLKQTKLINELKAFNWNKEEIKEILNQNDIDQIITTFKENRKDF